MNCKFSSFRERNPVIFPDFMRVLWQRLVSAMWLKFSALGKKLGKLFGPSAARFLKKSPSRNFFIWRKHPRSERQSVKLSKGAGLGARNPARDPRCGCAPEAVRRLHFRSLKSPRPPCGFVPKAGQSRGQHPAAFLNPFASLAPAWFSRPPARRPACVFMIPRRALLRNSSP